MPSPTTKSQISKIIIDSEKPLLVCDVDEVIVHFLKGLEIFLDELGLWLDPASFALNGNIKSLKDNSPAPNEQVGDILKQFFDQKTTSLAPIVGAVEALDQLSLHMQIVLLSNLPHGAYQARIKNMKSIGVPYPLITNEGGKGPAVALLTQVHKSDVFFIDDIPQYLTSVGEHCPHTKLIHFAHDDRFARHAPNIDLPHFKADKWPVVSRYVLDHLGVISN